MSSASAIKYTVAAICFVLDVVAMLSTLGLTVCEGLGYYNKL